MNNNNQEVNNETAEAEELKNYLKNIYYDQRSPAGFSAPKVIYDFIKAQGERVVTMKQIVNFLRSEEVYTTHFPFKRPKYNTPTIAPRIRFQYDIDSGYLASKSKRGNKYFVLAIDVFTRKIMARAVKDLKRKSVVPALRAIIEGLGIVENIRSDRGSEYFNGAVKKLFDSYNIKHYAANPPHKASYAERAMRTIKNGLYKNMQAKGVSNWSQNLLNDTVQ